MKSKKLIILALSCFIILVVGSWYSLRIYTGTLRTALEIELIDNQFPNNVDLESPSHIPAWVTLPFGYTLGPWPTEFRGNPIVMKMTYLKGPPAQFIQQMTQIWDPINAELTMEGPKTPVPSFGNYEWKSCLRDSFRCFKEKRKLYDLTLKDLEKWNSTEWKLTWFESMDPFAPKGIHVHLDLPKFQIDRFLVITDKGVTQSFTLKSIRGPVGMDAQVLFIKTLGAMKVKDNLSNARAWIQSVIQHVRLDKVKSNPSSKLRYAKLIQIQNQLFSELSVDPTSIAPFFHLAGVTHMLAVDLIRGKNKVYDHQDSWISHVEPLLNAILKYVGDFPKSEKEVKNIESLLQDILLLEQKLSK